MNKNNKSRSASRQRTPNGKENTVAYNNHNIILSNPQQKIKLSAAVDAVYDLLPTGRSSAIHVRDLMGLTGLTDRAVRSAVEVLRLHDVLICGDGFGLYRPANLDELRKWEKHRTATARAIYRTTREARRILRAADNDNPDQLSLWDQP